MRAVSPGAIGRRVWHARPSRSQEPGFGPISSCRPARPCPMAAVSLFHHPASRLGLGAPFGRTLRRRRAPAARGCGASGDCSTVDLVLPLDRLLVRSAWREMPPSAAGLAGLTATLGLLIPR